ncbi:hypothetical protein [Mucilaginibacter sp. 10I4]|uniref:hypothetical protein n=1 Tax=Mucilaginibacter sp. 10I4 TaxID=3048580 RepID=UPI002B238A5F|nr:hypothetical protein [Mucilaginibacter sp. 10I4]MEB0260753.1 hypothetical protein [Mucilaginibacter sp. 10I4]
MSIIFGIPITLTAEQLGVVKQEAVNAYISANPPIIPQNLAAFVLQNNSDISIFLDWYDANGVLVSNTPQEILPNELWCTPYSTKPQNYIGYKVHFSATPFFTRTMRIPFDNTLIVGSSGGVGQTEFGHVDISTVNYPYFVQFNKMQSL